MIMGVAALIASVPSGASGASIDVTIAADTVADDGECSLREAITATNTNADVGGADDCDHDAGTGPDTILLPDPAPAAFYDVNGSGDDTNATGDLDITAGTGGLTIRGDGQTETVIDADGADRVIDHRSGALALEDLTVRDGEANDGGGGGGIRSGFGGTSGLTLTRADVLSNEADSTGAAINAFFDLTITDSVVAANVATVDSATHGGGITTRAATTISGSIISGNSLVVAENPGAGAASFGGGIAQLFTGSLSIINSSVQANSIVVQNALDFPQGGGIAASNANVVIGGSVVKGNSTTGGNSAGSGGGGIAFDDGTADNTMTIVNSTFGANTVGSGQGGGLRISRGVTTVSNATIAGNSASLGKAIRYSDSGQAGSAVTLRGTILSEGGAAECSLPSSAITSDGYNVDAGNTCLAADGTSLFNTDPLLGPLDDNGGPTDTQPLDPASEAINLMPADDCVNVQGLPLFGDQRGAPRPGGAGCDAGAYERAKCRGALIGPGAFIGTQLAEVIKGNSFDNVIIGGAGKDTLKGNGGADRVCAGAGSDRVRGGNGKDRLSGADGDDALNGGRGKDACNGGPGKDKLSNCE